MTNDELKELQNTIVESSKQIVIADGHMVELGIVITKQSNVDAIFNGGFSIEYLDISDTFKPPSDGIAVLVVDIASDAKKLFSAACSLYPHISDKLKLALEKARTIFGIPESDTHRQVMRHFMEVTGTSYKDIIAGTIRRICQKVNAFAALMVSGAWMLSLEEEINEDTDIPDNVSDNPNSKEVIMCSMDALEFRRMLCAPILRAPSEKSIIGFDETEETIDNKDGESPLEGRFLEFLNPVSTAQA